MKKISLPVNTKILVEPAHNPPILKTINIDLLNFSEYTSSMLNESNNAHV